MNPSYDECADPDEDQHDTCLGRMKEEGMVREEHANDSSDDSGEETDEPLNPGEEEDVAEESDSNASASSSSNDGDSDREEKKRRQPKKAKMAKDRKSRKKAPQRKEGQGPQCPQEAHVCLHAVAECQPGEDQVGPSGISVTDLS